MKVTIEYCVMWNYFPKAASLADAIMNNVKDVDIEFIKSSGGVFEVTKDGALIHSKARTGNFPDEDEIINKLK